MNLHFLFSCDPAVITNMTKLLQTNDVVILLDEAAHLGNSPKINSWPCKNIHRLNTTCNEAADLVTPIDSREWVALSESAALIHSWY